MKFKFLGGGPSRQIRLMLLFGIGYVFVAGWIFVSLVLGSYGQIRMEYSDALDSLEYSKQIRVDLVEIRSRIGNVLEQNHLTNEADEKIRLMDAGVRERILYTKSKYLNKKNTEQLAILYDKYKNYQEQWREGRTYLKLGYPVPETIHHKLSKEEAAFLKELSAFESSINENIQGLDKTGMRIIRIGTALFMFFALLLCVILTAAAMRLQRHARESINEVEDKLNRFLVYSGANPIVLGQENEIGHIGEVIDNLLDIQDQMVHRERLSSLGQMAGGLAHNLKTPLMAMGANVTLLKRKMAEVQRLKTEDPEHLEEGLAAVNFLIEKMPPLLEYSDQIVDALLRQTRARENPLDETFTCRQIIGQIRILLDYEVKKRRGELRFIDDVPEGFRIRGARDAMVQVLSNLVLNALQSYEQDGGWAEVHFYPWDGGVGITVRDEGSGIEESVKQRLMNEVVTTKGVGGTGLGLYISNLIIKAGFNGSLEIDSKPGMGTTVSICIPESYGITY